LRNESRLALPLLAAFTLSCAADGGDPPSVATVVVSPNPATVEVGDSRQFTAVARDADGDVLGGRTFSWTSTATGTATVSTSGLAVGVAAGMTTIRAETGGVTGSAQLTVTAPGPASVTIDTDSTDVAVGQNVQLAATVRDGDGMIISASVTWSSANDAIATVDGSGLVMGVSEGTTQVTASAGGVDSDPTIIVVIPPGNVTVSSITPSPMVEGQSATLRGEGFSATAAQNNVTINGFSAPVTSASDTLLVIDVPEECFPAGDVTVAISTPTGSSGAVAHPMQPAKASLSMAVGEFMLIQDPADFCLQFGEQLLNEEYVFGVQSVLENANNLTDVRVRAQLPTGSVGSVATAYFAPQSPLATAVPVTPTRFEEALRRHRIAEAGLRHREREMALRFRNEIGAAATAGATAGIPDGLSVGDTIDMRVPNINGSDFCNDFATVDAVVRVVGSRGVWLEDVLNPTPRLSVSQIQTLSDMLDDQIHDVDVAWFGSFTDFDENDRVAILISREVNALGGVAGFVVSSDLLPGVGVSCPGSNDGELYYSITPDPGGSLGGPALDAAGLFALSPVLIAHELAHVIQFGRRFVQMPFQGIMTAWEMESQATFAEEVNGFVDTGREPGQNYGPDVSWGNDGTLGSRWFASEFTRIASYQGWDGNQNTNDVSIPGAPEQCTFVMDFGDGAVGPCFDGEVGRYMMALFYRWISDNVATSEAEAQAFHRGFIDNDMAGFDNITDVVGEPFSELLAQWAATLYADDRAVSLDPRVSMESWDLPAIFGAVDPSTRLEPYSFGFAAFSSDVRVRAGSSAYYLVSGLNRPHTAIRARALSGVQLPTFTQMWIVRLQ